MVLVKRFYLDLLINKLVNENLSINVVLYIQEFEVDFSSKKNTDQIKENINTNSLITRGIQNFYYTYTINELKEKNLKNNFSVYNFKNKNFPGEGSFYNVISNDNWLFNTNIIINDSYHITKVFIFDEENRTENRKIAKEEIKKIDLTNVFRQEPTKVERFTKVKRKREEDMELPEKIRNLISKNRQITLKDFESYICFKKSEKQYTII
jgi:hypothetical protein